MTAKPLKASRVGVEPSWAQLEGNATSCGFILDGQLDELYRSVERAKAFVLDVVLAPRLFKCARHLVNLCCECHVIPLHSDRRAPLATEVGYDVEYGTMNLALERPELGWL